MTIDFIAIARRKIEKYNSDADAYDAVAKRIADKVIDLRLGIVELQHFITMATELADEAMAEESPASPPPGRGDEPPAGEVEPPPSASPAEVTTGIPNVSGADEAILASEVTTPDPCIAPEESASEPTDGVGTASSSEPFEAHPLAGYIGTWVSPEEKADDPPAGEAAASPAPISKGELVRRAIEAHPDWTARQVAEHLVMSTGSVSGHASLLGLKFAPARQKPASASPIKAAPPEIDPAAAAILEQLIADGVIATGVVDTRSIKDIQPHDLDGFTQCHFFAGGGIWSVAARLAGWDDARPLWTGSCPCQPFSAAGKGLGADDPRHLWPDFHRLIRACRPPVVVGEQVAGKAGYGWLDGVRADLAREGYSSRGVDIPACAVDAPHQRNRLYWVALADGYSDQQGEIGEVRGRALSEPSRNSKLVDATSERWGEGRAEPELRGRRSTIASAYASGVTLGDALVPRLEGHTGHGDEGRGSKPGRPVAASDGAGAAGDMGHASGGGGQGAREREAHHRQAWRGKYRGPVGRNGSAWADAEWITCHDGKARRAKSGLRLLVDGLPGRVDLWRVGGNAIVPAEAAEVLGALLDVLDDDQRAAA